MLRCRDAPFGLLLEHVQDVIALGTSLYIHGDERATFEVGLNLQHARRNTFQGFRIHRHLALLYSL